MKKQWIKSILITYGIVLVFGLFLYATWIPRKKYKANCAAFCNTLKHFHGFYDVQITDKGLPMPVRGVLYADWYITLRGVIDTREMSKIYAKLFADSVTQGYALVDSITVIYADDSTVVREYAFANSELTE